VHNLGRIPKPGEKIELSGYRFLVLEADPRKAVKVRIEPVSPTQSS
jgi:CBS domain containing-hemolysin-like protein